MRTRNSLLNVLFNAAVQFINIVLMLAVRRIFSEVLGDDILGINSIYSSITSFLGLSELGLGVTVAVCLYKPMAEGNQEKVMSYMYFLRRVYTLIGLFIIAAGICLLPFLSVIIREGFDQTFMAISFEMYVLSAATTYFFSHKKIILSANQRDYIISFAQAIYKICIGVWQLLALILTRNYYVFILVAIVCNFGEGFIVAFYCDKRYPYLKKKAKPLCSDEINDIKIKVSGSMFYKMANYVIQSTDNIIISIFLGTTVVAYYNNYYLILNMMFAIFANVAVSSQAGMGNILYTDNERMRFVLSKLILIQQYVFSFSSTAFFVLCPFFIKTIFPSTSQFELPVIFLMVLIHYIRGYSEGIESMRIIVAEYSDRYINLGIAALNIVISVLLVRVIGISGVLVGTLVCYVIKEFVVVPRIVFKKVLLGGLAEYLKKTASNILITLFICGLIYAATIIVPINSWLFWVIYGFASLAVSLLVNSLMYCRTDEFRELKEYASNMAIRIIKRN